MRDTVGYWPDGDGVHGPLDNLRQRLLERLATDLQTVVATRQTMTVHARPADMRCCWVSYDRFHPLGTERWTKDFCSEMDCAHLHHYTEVFHG